MYIISSELYLLYAKLEEEHGLARHAIAVYERATTAVLPEEQYEVNNFYNWYDLLVHLVFNYI